MKLFYKHDGIKIYHGDCRDIISNIKNVDLVCTDPPYGIGEAAGKNKSRSKIIKAKDYGNKTWDDKPIDNELMKTVIKVGKYAAVFGGNYYSMSPSSCWLVWDKMNGNSHFADAELVWTNYKKAVRIKKHLWNGMFRNNQEQRYHPTQKPLEVIQWVISLCPIKPKIIFDPFMGSGTTLVAAKNIGCKAIGIEREKEYCDIAVERLRQGILPL